MKLFTRSFLRAPRVVLAMSSVAVLPLLAVDPATVLPDDSIAYIEMDSQGIYKLADHPIVKSLPLKDLEKMMLKLSGSTPEDQEAMKKLLADETGVSYEELEKKAGRFAVSIHDLKIPDDPTPENVGGEISLAYEFDADEAFMEKYFKALIKLMGEQMKKQGGSGEDIEKFISKAADYTEQSTEEHNGAKIHVIKLKDTEETKEAPAFVREWAYAIHEKMILAGSGQEQVEEMLDRMKSGGETGSLAASPYYKADRDKAGKSLGVASLNLEVILGLVEKHALPAADNSDIDVKKVWKALGADKLQSALLAFGAGEDTLDVAALMTYSEKPGLFGVLAIPGSGTPPAFLPKGLSSASYQQIDIAKTIANVEKLANEIDPRAGQGIQMGLSMAESQIGVDIRKDLFGQLGPDIWMAAAAGGDSAAGDGGQSGIAGIGATEMALMGLAGSKSVIGIKVKDSRAFGLALDTIFNKVAQKDAIFESREYQGFTIFNVKESPEEFRVGYVLTDEWLIVSVGAGETLEQILPRLSKSGDDGFFAQKSITRHLDAMRSGQGTTGVTDVGATLSSLMTLLEGLVKSSGAATPEIPFDELKKLLNVPLLSIDKAWIDEKHMEYRARIAPKGE